MRTHLRALHGTLLARSVRFAATLCATGVLLTFTSSEAFALPGPECIERRNALPALALGRLVDAVNDGGALALDAAIRSLTDTNKFGADRRQGLAMTLARWHWTSGRLTTRRLCVLSPVSAFALVENRLTGETDSLQISVDSVRGELRGMGFGFGVAVPVALADTLSDDARVKVLSELTHRMADGGMFAGEVLLARNGRVLFHEAAGTSNRETHTPARVGDAYNIASVGKIFTATAIMQLVERGRLNLDDTLGKFLPDSTRPKAAGRVPLATILSHTDGIVRGADTLAFQPGTRFSYVNTGYALLGAVIESVVHEPFADWYQRSIFQPAGMTSTRRLVRSGPDPALPPAYEFEFDSSGAHFRRNDLVQTIPATGAGGFFSTVDDLFHFAEALRTGKLVSPATLALMRAPKPELGSREYGYGVDLYRGHGIWGHSGFLPGANTDLELYGDSGYVLVIVSNTGTNDPIRRRVAALLSSGAK